MLNAIKPGQARAARALLNWRREDLAEASGVPLRTISGFELGETKPQKANMEKLIAAFAAAGIEFTNGDAPGLKMHPKPEQPGT